MMIVNAHECGCGKGRKIRFIISTNVDGPIGILQRGPNDLEGGDITLFDPSLDISGSKILKIGPKQIGSE